MTNLKQLLAFNIKQHRTRLGLTQAKLAEKARASTQYIAMIELGRKFPSIELLERIATALKTDNLDLFTPPPFPVENLLTHQKAFLYDLEKEVVKSVNDTVQKAVKTVVNKYLIEGNKKHRT